MFYVLCFMTKVLILGAKGMLGQELVKTFSKDKGYEVFAWDKNELEITDQKEVNKKISELKPDIIINSAAYNAVDKCEEPEEFALAKKINGEAPGYLAKIAKESDAIFVQYSTDYVFNGLPEIPEPAGCSHRCSSCELHKDFTPEIGFDENAKPNPISNYGRSKLMGEKAVQENTEKYYIIRLSKLFGEPASLKDAKRSFFDVMLEIGRDEKKKEVKVIDEETSCFTYAPDLAKKTKEIIEAEKPFGIFHVTNVGPCTWHEAVLELYKQAKIKKKVIPISADEFPRSAKRPYISTLINTKLNPLRNYKEALKEYLKIHPVK